MIVLPVVYDDGWGGIQIQVKTWMEYSRHQVPAIAIRRHVEPGIFENAVLSADGRSDYDLAHQVGADVIFTHALNHDDPRGHLPPRRDLPFVTFHHCAYPPRFARDMVDGIMTQSQANLRMIIHAWGDHALEIATIPLSCLPIAPRIGSKSVRAHYGVADDHRLVGRIGRLEPIKRIEHTIHAVRLVVEMGHPIHLLIGGQLSIFYGPEYIQRLRHECERLGLSYTITGALSEQEKWDILHALDVYLYPTAEEGYCLSILEAMGAGVPVVTYDQPVLREVTGGHAFLAHDQDIEDLAHYLSLALEMRASSLMMAERARLLVHERNRPGHVAAMIDEYLERIIQRG